MTDKLTIYQDFLALQDEISNPEKTKKVTVKLKNSDKSYDFLYAPLDAIINQIRPILSKHNFFVVQEVDETNSKNWIITNFVHVTGEKITSKIPFPEIIPGMMQDYGGKLTYLKRYGLCMALFIAAEDDVDANDRKGQFNKKQIKTQVANYMSEIAKAQDMRELMGIHGSYKEMLDCAKTLFPDQIYNKSQDGMSADEYFAFLFKHFRDGDRKEQSDKDIDKQHEQSLKAPE